MILLLTKDLFFIPVLRSAAEQAGTTVAVAPSTESPAIEKLDASQVNAVVIDLAGFPTSAIGPTVTALRERFPTATINAFGPHVQEARLQAAEQANCDQVLTRGQFNRNTTELVRQWSQQM